MHRHDTWARSLYHGKEVSKKEPCIWSDEFGVVIHRFNLGQQTCNCGEITIMKKETKGGWKREPIDDESKNGE